MTDPETLHEPAPMHEHALSHLRYIREAMERATAFTSIPGWGGFIVGLTALATAVIAHSLSPRDWLLIWLAEAVLAALIAIVAMFRKARRDGVAFHSTPPRRFFVGSSAPLVAGAALTYVLGHIGRYDVLPATWLLLYGTSFVSSGAYSIPVVPVMGVCFMVLGIVGCFVPLPAGNVLLGAGFGGLHIVFGLIIARSYGG